MPATYQTVGLLMVGVKVLDAWSCLTLRDPMDCSHQAPLSMGFSQARTQEWVAMPSSRGSSQPRDQTQVSCVSFTDRQILYQ